MEDRVGRFGRGPIGPLDHEARLHPIGVVLVDLRADRGGHEDVAGLLDQLRVRHRLGAREVDHAAVFLHVRLELRHVQALVVPDRPVDVADADDGAAVVREQTRHHAADVAESLDHHPLVPQLVVQMVSGLVEHRHDAPAGGFPAPMRAPEDERLAGHHPGHTPALRHRVGVHHPRHGLLVGPEIGGRNVQIGPDQGHDLGGVASGQAFALPQRQPVGRAAHAALRAPERQAHERALPGHEHRERAHLAQVHARVVPEPALARPQRGVVMDPVSDEHLRPPVVHEHGEGDGERPPRIPQPLVDTGLDIQVVRDRVQLGQNSSLERRFDRRLDSHGPRHGYPSASVIGYHRSQSRSVSSSTAAVGPIHVRLVPCSTGRPWPTVRSALIRSSRSRFTSLARNST